MVECRATYYSEILERDLTVDLYTDPYSLKYSTFIEEKDMKGYSHRLKNLFENITDEDKENYGEGNIFDGYGIVIVMPLIFKTKGEKLSKELEKEIIRQLNLPEISFEMSVTGKTDKDKITEFLTKQVGEKSCDEESKDKEDIENLIKNAAQINRDYYKKRNKNTLSYSDLGLEKGSKSYDTVGHIKTENASEESIYEMIINEKYSFEVAEKILNTTGRTLLTQSERSKTIREFIKDQEKYKENYTISTLNSILENNRTILINIPKRTGEYE